MNVRRAVAPVVCLIASVISALAQHRVDPASMYSRIYVIVPMTGSGTWDDPRRPMFAPVPQQMIPGNRAGILGVNHVESDDGKFALMEVVVATRPQLNQLIAEVNNQLAATPGFELFDRSTSSPAAVQAAFQILKKDFDITKFRLVVP